MEASEITFSSEVKKPLKIGNTEYLSTYDFSLTEKELEKACKELGETEEIKIRKLQELREKLAGDKGVTYRTDTPYLLRYLRVRKYDANKVYQNLKEGYILKKKYHESFRVSDDLDQLLNRRICITLPYTDEEGNMLFYLDLGKWNCQEISFDEMVQTLSAVCEVMTMNPRMQVNGAIGIWDTKGVTMEHIKLCIRNWGLREISFGFQNLYPWRVKKVVAINAGRISRLFFSMIRPFLSKKIQNRVIILGSDLKELHQHVNPALLPKNLGGYLDEKQCNLAQHIIDNIPYLKYDISFTLNKKLSE